MKDLDDLVEAALQYYSQKKILDNTALPLRLEKDNDPRLVLSPLKFPGKLAIDVLNNRLFISDSNHNRIVSIISRMIFSWSWILMSDEYVELLSLACLKFQMVTDLDGNFIIQIGSTGEEGLRDGTFEDASFNRPQVGIV